MAGWPRGCFPWCGLRSAESSTAPVLVCRSIQKENIGMVKTYGSRAGCGMAQITTSGLLIRNRLDGR